MSGLFFSISGWRGHWVSTKEQAIEIGNNPIYPECGQADQVQKVSCVYNANTEEWYEEELSMDVLGHIEDRKAPHEAVLVTYLIQYIFN